MSVIWTLTRSSFCVGYEKIMRNLSSLHCVMNMRTLTGSQFRPLDSLQSAAETEHIQICMAQFIAITHDEKVCKTSLDL